LECVHQAQPSAKGANTEHWSQVNQAAGRIRPLTRRTPCQEFDGGLWLKREDLQSGGSFKMRGVANVMMLAASRSELRGAVCVSTGNTAHALALIGRRLDVPVHVYATADLDSRHATRLRALGAAVTIAGDRFSSAASAARTFADAAGLLFCSPGASWDFSYGCGTVASEIVGAVAGLATMYVPIGGGGLAAGVGAALTALPPTRRPDLIGVQVAGSPFIYEYFHYGHVSTSAADPSIAGCLNGDLEEGATLLEVAHDVLTDVLLVTDDELLAAQRLLAEAGVDVEPGAAAAYAGLQKRERSHSPRGPRCVLITGGQLPDAPRP
jgi:threonine dehydratase